MTKFFFSRKNQHIANLKMTLDLMHKVNVELCRDVEKLLSDKQKLNEFIDDNMFWIQDTHGQGTRFVVDYELLVSYLKGEKND